MRFVWTLLPVLASSIRVDVLARAKRVTAFRAISSLTPRDTYASALAGTPDVLAAVATWARLASLHGDSAAANFVEVGAVRSRYVDEAVQQAVSDGAQQVVFLGCGLDSRVYRLDCLKDVDVIELDAPDVIEAKRVAFIKLGVTPKTLFKRSLPVHRMDEWRAHVTDAGFNPYLKTVFAAEGFLEDEESTLASLSDATQMCRAGGVFIFDMFEKARTVRDLARAAGHEVISSAAPGSKHANYGVLDTCERPLFLPDWNCEWRFCTTTF